MAMTAPYEVFRTADGHVFIAAGNDRLFRNVCQGLDLVPIADDARFATNVARVQNRVALHEALEAATRQLTAGEIVARLRLVGAPCSELNDVSQVLAHPQIAAVRMMASLPVPGAPDHQVVDLPLTASGERGRSASPPPALGADTRQTLMEIGYETNRIDALIAAGAIA
jgi:crotonobetainyl-CoA:carnitine CoA-transferase CaiB-like acyl-CoA transferase